MNSIDRHVPEGAGIGSELLASTLMRDCISYAFVKFVIAFGGTIFGGFVSSHWSGFPTNDIDIMMEDKHVIELFKSMVIAWMSENLDVRMDMISFHLTRVNKYSHRHRLKVRDCEIQVDISTVHGVSKICGKLSCRPVSWGRLMAYNKYKGFHFRNLPCIDPAMCPFTVDHLCKFLSNGMDRLIIDQWSQKNHFTYFESRVMSLSDQGYTFDVSVDEAMEMVKNMCITSSSS